MRCVQGDLPSTAAACPQVPRVLRAVDRDVHTGCRASGSGRLGERLEDPGRSEEWEADTVHLFGTGVHEGEGDGVVGRFVDCEKGGVDDGLE